MLRVQCINGVWYAVDDSDVSILIQCGLDNLAFLSFKLLSDHMATYGIETVKCSEISYNAA